MTEKGKAPKLPSRDECIELLRKYSCDEEIIRHCIAVEDLAVKISRKCRADTELVSAGALLHDIGRCRSHGMDHAVHGAEIIAELELPKQLLHIVERHIGAGITPKEAVRLCLPRKDYTPRTLEERIVAHADNLMSGDRRTHIEEAVTHVARMGNHEAALKIMRLHEELSKLCGINIDKIR